jgi:hypothetical protein
LNFERIEIRLAIWLNNIIDRFTNA